MVEARKDDDKMPAADSADELSRLAAASARILAGQTTAMAMMTVYGIRAASEMTSMMLGALRGDQPSDASNDRTPPAAQMPDLAKVVPLHRDGGKPADGVPADTPAPPRKAAKTTGSRGASSRPSVSRPARARASSTAGLASRDRDDLKKISGIGPRLEEVLNARGIMRYADLAALRGAALKKLDMELGLEGRIVRDDWAGQAKTLSGGKD